MATTTYTIDVPNGETYETTDTAEAQHAVEVGCTVTAVTHK